MKRLIIFDLEGTLTESKAPLDAEMPASLLKMIQVAVISGDSWPQYQKQFLPSLPSGANLGNFSLLPTCGTQFYQYSKLISEFSVRMGGTTSIDITKPGIDKAYGIRKLRVTLGIDIPDMIFVGDALFPGGNDYPAKEAGVVSIQVRDPGETKRVVETVVACMKTPHGRKEEYHG